MTSTSRTPAGPDASGASITADGIKALIVQWFAEKEKPLPEDTKASFDELGMNSLDTVELGLFLAAELHMPIDEMVVYSYPTIDDLSSHLADEARQQAE